MKQLVLVSLLALSGAAFATAGADISAHIEIDGTSVQTAIFSNGSSVKNKATGYNAKATQNISSNSGNVDVHSGGKSTQTTNLNDASVKNQASGVNAYAVQNLSSNMGDVDIKGKSTQLTTVAHSMVSNYSSANTKAVQNIASNNGCSTCK